MLGLLHLSVLGTTLCLVWLPLCVLRWSKMPLVYIALAFTVEAAFQSMSRVLTLMPTSSLKFARLLCFCKCFSLMCYTLVLSSLLFEVGFEFNLVSFWGCLKFISHAFDCFIQPFEPSRMRLGKFFAYLLTELLEIQWMNQHGSLSSYHHIGVYVILEEVIQFSKRFLLALGGLWRVTSLLFKRNPLMHHMLPIPTTHWTILWPLVFVVFIFG